MGIITAPFRTRAEEIALEWEGIAYTDCRSVHPIDPTKQARQSRVVNKLEIVVKSIYSFPIDKYVFFSFASIWSSKMDKRLR